VETNSSHPASDGHFQVHLTMVLAAPKNTKRREGTYDREINGAMCRHGSDFFWFSWTAMILASQWVVDVAG